MQKSSSSALARQLTGVITMPASWQAQCSVAACLAILQHRDKVVAGLQPECGRASHQRRNPPIPLRVGQAHAAVDDRQRVGIARHAGDKAGSKIKHRRFSPLGRPIRRRPRAPPRRSAHSRCSGTDGRSSKSRNARLVRLRVLAQEAVERHQDAGGAEAALQRVMAPERLLQTPRAGRPTARGLRRCGSRSRRPARRASGRRAPACRRSATVQAPHTPCSQPTWVPVAPSWWRRKSVSSMRGSASPATARPLSVKRTGCRRPALRRGIAAPPRTRSRPSMRTRSRR